MAGQFTFNHMFMAYFQKIYSSFIFPSPRFHEFQALKFLVYVENKLSSLGRRRYEQSKSKLPCPLLQPLPLAQVPQVLHQHQHHRRRRAREPTQRLQVSPH